MRRALIRAITRIVGAVESRFQVNGDVISAVAGGRVEQRTELMFRYLTWRKVLNLVRTEFELRRGRVRLTGAPFEWEIDTTNICQLKCPLCHTGLGNIRRDQGVMHYDLFTKIVDQIQHSALWLTLYSWGEPFLNPRIHDFVGYAHDRGLATIISSNLNRPLTEQMAEDIIRSGLDVMVISLDGVTQEVYEQYRVNGHLSRVLENIRLLARKKQELGMTTPYLEWQFIVMRQNEHQMDDARRLARELGVDDIVFKKVDFPHQMEDAAVAEQWLPTSLEYQRGNAFDKPYEEQGERCWRLWRSAVVNWDGGLSPCCYLTDKAQDFGDVTTHSIRAIWNGEAYTASRGLFREDFTPTRAVGCMHCPVYTDSPTGRARGPIEAHLEPANRQPLPALANVDWETVTRETVNRETNGGASRGSAGGNGAGGNGAATLDLAETVPLGPEPAPLEAGAEDVEPSPSTVRNGPHDGGRGR